MNGGHFYTVSNDAHDRFMAVVGVSAWGVYTHLCRRARGDIARASFDDICDVTGLSRPTVAKAITRLIHAEMIVPLHERTQPGYYRINHRTGKDSLPVATSKDSLPVPQTGKENEPVVVFAGSGTVLATSKETELIQDYRKRTAKSAPDQARALAVASYVMSPQLREQCHARGLSDAEIEEGVEEWRDVRTRNSGQVNDTNVRRYLFGTYVRHTLGRQPVNDIRVVSPSKRTQQNVASGMAWLSKRGDP